MRHSSKLGILPILVTACIYAGCGSQDKAQLHALSTNPQVTRDQAKAEKIVQGCTRKANFFTRRGRKAFVSCIAPPGKKVQVERCAQKDLGRDGFLSHAAARRLSQDIATCLL